MKKRIFNRKNNPPIIILDIVSIVNEMDLIEKAVKERLSKRMLLGKKSNEVLIETVSKIKIDGNLYFKVKFKHKKEGPFYIMFNESLSDHTAKYSNLKIENSFVVAENNNGLFKITPSSGNAVVWDIIPYKI